MKKQLLTRAGNFVRSLMISAALPCAAAFAVSCSDEDPNAERSEFIRVYTDTDEDPIDQGYVDVRGGLASVFVAANVGYDVYWQDGGTSPWIEIISKNNNAKPGFDEIVLNVQPRETYSYYTRRTGSLVLASPDKMLGKFIPVHQGAEARISQNFSWLTYGNTSPLVAEGEKPYSGWTDVQKNYGWTTSTPAYCFGKNGYVKLGDAEGHGADLLTPLTASLRNDSLLMVSFRAVTYTDANNATDNNKLTVNILGGGEFIDTQLTSRQIETGTYTVENDELNKPMWTDSSYLLFITGTETNPITADTRIRFVAGDPVEPGTGNSRIFLDNIYVYTLNSLNYGMIEDNKGTDKDIILGRIEEESTR